ncbi:MAG: PASTA domain-containing protein [Ruminococcaceae bacterium]|nr:PASTA domain-containing protein [Oscillospiraceae bacterium]
MPLCMGCLNEITNSSARCENCGFDNSVPQNAPFLPYGTVLNNKYVVAKDLSTNGESTCYLGYDKTTGKVITIREFLPIGLFSRDQDEKIITILPDAVTNYSVAVADFETYYRKIMSLSDMSAMIVIDDIFRENNTCYVIEETNDHIPFSDYVKKNGGQLDWDVARPLFMPIISLLEALHKVGIGHYAVSPSNLFVNSEGKLILTGFSTENERKRGTMLKSQLFSGCAAPEQYRNDNVLDASTDVYGFTATLFFALTGKLPANAKERTKDSRLLISTNTVKRLPPHVVSTLANGLQMRRDVRISDFEELRSQLSVASTVQAIQEEISRTASMTPIKKDDGSKSKVSATAVGIVATIVALLVFSAVGLYWLSINPLKGLFIDETVAPTMVASTEDWTGPVVADYTGKSYEDVVASAEADGSITLKVSADGEFSDSVPQGYVVSQTPAAGEPITSNSSVLYVVLSKGPEMKELPEVADKSLEDASKELIELGFIVLQDTEYSGSYSEGTVMGYSNFKAGDKVESGSEITLRVSKGTEVTDEE